MMSGVKDCPRTFFFFNDTATTEIYTLSLHDALPIYEPSTLDFEHRLRQRQRGEGRGRFRGWCGQPRVRHLRRRLRQQGHLDRKSTRLNSSHANISYAVFCLKKNTPT